MSDQIAVRPRGPNRAKFETGSRRRVLALGRADVTITAMTYLQAQVVTVSTKAQLLRALARVLGYP
jgi:hypothetical protein